MNICVSGWSGSDLNSISLRGFSCLQDFNVPDGDSYECFERFTPEQAESRQDRAGVTGGAAFKFCFSWKLLTTILLQLRLESLIPNLNKSLLTPTKSYLSNSGRSDSIIPIDSICGIVHYEITLHKLCLLSGATLPTLCIYNIL